MFLLLMFSGFVGVDFFSQVTGMCQKKFENPYVEVTWLTWLFKKSPILKLFLQCARGDDLLLWSAMQQFSQHLTESEQKAEL